MRGFDAGLTCRAYIQGLHAGGFARSFMRVFFAMTDARFDKPRTSAQAAQHVPDARTFRPDYCHHRFDGGLARLPDIATQTRHEAGLSFPPPGFLLTGAFHAFP